MMEKLLEKMKLGSKEQIKNLVIFLILVIIIMVVMNEAFPKEKNVATENMVTSTRLLTEEESFEHKLEKILSSIQGVGSVSVLISYEDTIEKVPLYDTKETTTVTEETDQNGGERKTKQTNQEYHIVYEETGNQKTALIRQNRMPKMMGVLVVAEGAQNSITKEKITEAVMTITGLSSNKIKVLAK